MFGFIRPYKPELRVREVERFQAMYCGLCHEIKRNYGRIQTYFLSYDMTFFSLVIGALDPHDVGQIACRCDASPFRRKQTACTCPSLRYTADLSVLLTYHKVQDSIRDETGPKRAAAYALHRAMYQAYQHAQNTQPILDQTIRQCLDELVQLEQVKTDSLDRPADTFARLLANSIPPGFPHEVQRILAQMFYHTGRWLYLIDACADLSEDFHTGAYNPIRQRFQLQAPTLDHIRDTLEHTLERSLLDIHTACQLLPLYRDQGLIENIIDLGLPLVTRQVLDGTYHANGGHETHGSL